MLVVELVDLKSDSVAHPRSLLCLDSPTYETGNLNNSATNSLEAVS